MAGQRTLVWLLPGEPPGPLGALVPPVRGLAFLSTRGAGGEALDRWWRDHVDPTALPAYVLVDEAGLEDWIAGTDGTWYVAVKDDARARLLAGPVANVVPLVGAEPAAVVARAAEDLGIRVEGGFAVPSPRLAEAALHEARTAEYSAASPPPPPHLPISYDIQPAVPPVVTFVPSPQPAPHGHGWRDVTRYLWPGRRAGWQASPGTLRQSRSRLGPTINAHRPVFVGFGSRKGGVGKTTHAAGVSATVGEALDGLPDTAALVDGNITNPDSWALNPPPDAATVRILVSRLTEGATPPPEQYARTPRLAIYPESRRSDEVYTQAEVDILAAYLGKRHSFVAIDLPNALPSLTSGGPAAVTAAWLAHCDVVVVPFDADPRARQGLLEYIEALASDGALASIPLVAAYIVSANRAIATDASVQEDLDTVRRLGVDVVNVPDDEHALLALLKDQPINRASPALRRAYQELADVVVQAAVRRHHGA